MAGVGVRLNRIFSKNTITTNLIGFGYSTMISIAPMVVVIGAVITMQYFLGFSKIGYAQRELYSCTLLYIFIFSLLTASPFNAVLSRYLSDVIYNETYEDILPCYYLGLIMNLILSALLGVPFCVHEYFAGGVDIVFIFAGYCGYMALVQVFYSMLYLSICKDYKKISLFFLIGMVFAVVLAFVLVKLFRVELTLAMLISMDAGFLLIGSLEFALIKSYFRENSGKYKEVLKYYKKYWQLVVTNLLYTAGLYVHNFVFWTTEQRMVVANSFVCNTNYDMASCLAMFTNITATVIFISRVEMQFHGRYRRYSEAVIGGRGIDIETAKKRMFRQLGEELMNLVRIQFIISVVAYLLCIVLLPQFGFGGLILRIYPCLAVGYFILFTMYAAIIFLYYFNDLIGAVLTSSVFFVTTLVCSIFATDLSEIWYGIGLVAGAFAGWSVAYYRLRVMEKNLDIHIFCNGNLMKRGKGIKPNNKVYDNGETIIAKKKKSVSKDDKAAAKRAARKAKILAKRAAEKNKQEAKQATKKTKEKRREG
ncbi:MAG: exopolysaccharide Pel transporter PelG [Agathobacter sp.]|nr:exopolysaccharide Pel transporter PelG [Agathobacter sp.]MBQ2282941.1 exopolysaccharide Pel transporter PelG [Agathobacter sp.]